MGSILAPENAQTIYMGAAKSFELLVTYFDKDGNEKPLNLTDCTIYFTARRLIQDAAPAIFKSSTDAAQIEKTQPTYGICEIHLGPADTRSLLEGDYVFDVWVKLPSGKPYPVVEVSTLTVKWAVTRLPG